MFHVPEDIPMDLMTLMAANLPTGYMVAANAAAGQPSKGGVCVVIGCGPVRPSPYSLKRGGKDP